MAMRIAPVPYFWSPVTFPMLTDMDTNEEKFVDVTLRVKFRRLETSAYQDLMKRIAATRMQALRALRNEIPASEVGAVLGASAEAEPGEGKPEEGRPITDREIIELVMLDWDDVIGDDDQKLPFNKDSLDRALSTLNCGSAIVKRFLDLHQKAQEKNFAGPSGTSTAAKR